MFPNKSVRRSIDGRHIDIEKLRMIPYYHIKIINNSIYLKINYNIYNDSILSVKFDSIKQKF